MSTENEGRITDETIREAVSLRAMVLINLAASASVTVAGTLPAIADSITQGLLIAEAIREQRRGCTESEDKPTGEMIRAGGEAFRDLPGQGRNLNSEDNAVRVYLAMRAKRSEDS